MDITAQQIQISLRELADPIISEHSQRFFKTGKGEYGVGDKFLGIRIRVLIKQLKTCKATSLKQSLSLLKSPYHEERLFALPLLVDKIKHADTNEQPTFFDSYLNNTQYINNWDLIDSSAHHIIGPR